MNRKEAEEAWKKTVWTLGEEYRKAVVEARKEEFSAGAHALLAECLTSEQRARQLLKFTDDEGIQKVIEELYERRQKGGGNKWELKSL